MVVCLCWSVSVRSVPSLLTRETLSFFSTKEEGEDDDGPVPSVTMCCFCSTLAAMQPWKD